MLGVTLVRDVLELVVAGFDVLEDEVLLELDVFDFASKKRKPQTNLHNSC
jgi:hypothetical protein